MTSRRTLLAAATVLPLLAAPGLALAQPDNFPSKALRIIVPFSAGGVVDSIARIVGDRLSAKYGQPVVVEAKARRRWLHRHRLCRQVRARWLHAAVRQPRPRGDAQPDQGRDLEPGARLSRRRGPGRDLQRHRGTAQHQPRPWPS